jgi:hypothetical protein
MKKFPKGTTVRYASQWLRAVGILTGDTAHARALVIGSHPRIDRLVRLYWLDGFEGPEHVAAANLGRHPRQVANGCNRVDTYLLDRAELGA